MVNMNEKRDNFNSTLINKSLSIRFNPVIILIHFYKNIINHNTIRKDINAQKNMINIMTSIIYAQNVRNILRRLIEIESWFIKRLVTICKSHNHKDMMINVSNINKEKCSLQDRKYLHFITDSVCPLIDIINKKRKWMITSSQSKDQFIGKKINKSNKVFMRKDLIETLLKWKKFKWIIKDFNRILGLDEGFFISILSTQ